MPPLPKFYFPLHPKTASNQLDICFAVYVVILSLVFELYKAEIIALMVQIFPVLTNHTWSVSLLIVVLSLMIYFVIKHCWLLPNAKKITLTIDRQGIKNQHFLYKAITPSIALKDIDRVEFSEHLTDKLLNRQAKPFGNKKQKGKCLIIYPKKSQDNSRHSPIVISTHVWQIDNFDALLGFFEQQGFCPSVFDDEKYIAQHVPAMQDLGERAGILAYVCIFLALLIVAVMYWDKYWTLDFANIGYYFVGIGVGVGVISGRFLYQENQQSKGFIVLAVFVPIATFCLFVLWLWFSPMVGGQKMATFSLNNDTWTANDRPELVIECKKNHAKKEADGKVLLSQTLGITRIAFDELDKLCDK